MLARIQKNRYNTCIHHTSFSLSVNRSCAVPDKMTVSQQQMHREDTNLGEADAGETPLSVVQSSSKDAAVSIPTASTISSSLQLMEDASLSNPRPAPRLSIHERCRVHRWSSMVEIESRKYHQQQNTSKSTNSRVSIHKINSDARMQQSQNSQVEALARESIQKQTASSLFIPLEEKLSYWQLVKRHVHQGTFHGTKSILKQPKTQQSKNPNNSPSIPRHSYRVRFATDVTTCRTWSLTRQFDKVPRDLHKHIWWSDTEQSFFYETMFDEVDPSEEDEYKHLLESAFHSVPTSQPSHENALMNFSSFVACSEARGLESYMCSSIETNVSRHRHKVLSTYHQLTAQMSVPNLLPTRHATSSSSSTSILSSSTNPQQPSTIEEQGESDQNNNTTTTAMVKKDCPSSLDDDPLCVEPYWLTHDLVTEIVALRSFKYSHSCRMVARKLAACDRALLALYQKEDEE